MTGRSSIRSCEDIDDTTLQYAEFKALATADPRIKYKMELDNEFNRLTLLKSLWVREQAQLTEKVNQTLPYQIEHFGKTLTALNEDIETATANHSKYFVMEFNGKTYEDREVAVKEMHEYIHKLDVRFGGTVKVGTYNGFEFGALYFSLSKGMELYIKGKGTYHTPYIVRRTISQIEKAVELLDDRKEYAASKLKASQNELTNAKAQLNQPFAYEEKLRELKTEKSKLELELEFVEAI